MHKIWGTAISVTMASFLGFGPILAQEIEEIGGMKEQPAAPGMMGTVLEISKMALGETFALSWNLVGTAATLSLKTLQGLASPIMRGIGTETDAAARAPLQVYSPEEQSMTCGSCGQQTLVRGKLPGLIVRCPACNTTL